MTIRSLRRRSNINARSIQTKWEGSRLRQHGSHRTEPAHWRKPWGQFLPGRLTERFAPRTPISLVLSVPSAWIGIFPDIQIVSAGRDRSGSTPLSHGHDPQSCSFLGADGRESCWRGGMADADDLKSSGGNPVWVQFPPPVINLRQYAHWLSVVSDLDGPMPAPVGFKKLPASCDVGGARTH